MAKVTNPSAKPKRNGSGPKKTGKVTNPASKSTKAKRQINQIRNAPKGVFHAMVTSVCESVMKSPNNYKELMTENHLNMPKIVDRVTLLYSFMETLNTTRLADMNESAIAEILEDLKK